MAEDGRPDEQRTELAEARTDLARERTALARERTLSAWLRTGLGAIAAGVGLAHLVGEGEPMPWLGRAAGVLLTVVGGTILAVALVRTSRDPERRAHAAMMPLWLLAAFAAVLFLGAILSLVFVLLR